MRTNKKELAKKLLITVACICILSYTIFHFASLFGEEIGTVVVGPSTEHSSITLDGYVFRDAELITSAYSGAVDYAVANGGRVAVGDELATVYEEGNLSEVRDLLLAVDEQIALLQRSVEEDHSMSDLTSLKKSASNAYYSIMKELADGGISGVEANSDKLLVALNSIEMLTNGDFSIEETLEGLLDARQTMLGAGGASETLRARESGYFYMATDGYERVFTGTAALTLDADALRELIYSATPERVSSSCIGKLSGDSVWYFALEIGEEYIESFAEGEEYSIELLGGGGYDINMTLSRRLDFASGEGGMLIFRTNVIPEGFGFERRQTAEIVLDSVSGIYIPSSAVHRVNFKDSVYILKGSVVCLRRIDVIYRGDDYYVVRDGGPADSDEAYLESNDLLIISGGNLFDGRILG